MRALLARRPSPAMVVALIALICALTGTAWAALGKNSVGTKQLKNNAVTSAKIKKEAVASAKIKNGAVAGTKIAAGAVSTANLATGAVSTANLADGSVSNGKLANDAVTGAKVKDGSLTGADIDQGSLTSVKAANVYGVTFAETGTGSPKILNASDPGIKSGGCFLVCSVEFPRNVSGCSYTAASSFTSGGSGEPAFAETFPSGSPNAVLVVMWNDEGNLTAHDFAMTVVCPTTS
jgi:hypothetical protein